MRMAANEEDVEASRRSDEKVVPVGLRGAAVRSNVVAACRPVMVAMSTMYRAGGVLMVRRKCGTFAAFKKWPQRCKSKPSAGLILASDFRVTPAYHFLINFSPTIRAWPLSESQMQMQHSQSSSQRHHLTHQPSHRKHLSSGNLRSSVGGSETLLGQC